MTALKIWAGILGGLAIQVCGLWLRKEVIPLFSASWWLIVAFGIAIYVWGCCLLASSKGYSRAWGLLGLTSCLGLVLLALFPRLKDAPPGSVDYSLTIYQRNAVLGLTLGMAAIFAAWAAAIFHFEGRFGSGYYHIPVWACYIVSIWGSFYLALRKGRHPLWALPSILTIPGWLLLFLLPDRYKREHAQLHWSLKEFQRGTVVWVCLFAILFVIQLPMFIAHRRAACDRAADADVVRLADVLAKFAKDTAAQNCDTKTLAPDFLEYIVGSYYGWKGTDRKSEVLIRIEDDVICACSRRGMRPRGDEHHYIYRVNFKTGERLPVMTGPCKGNSYGGPDAMCYGEGVLGPDCKFKKPSGKRCE